MGQEMESVPAQIVLQATILLSLDPVLVPYVHWANIPLDLDSVYALFVLTVLWWVLPRAIHALQALTLTPLSQVLLQV